MFLPKARCTQSSRRSKPCLYLHEITCFVVPDCQGITPFFAQLQHHLTHPPNLRSSSLAFSPPPDLSDQLYWFPLLRAHVSASHLVKRDSAPTGVQRPNLWAVTRQHLCHYLEFLPSEHPSCCKAASDARGNATQASLACRMLTSPRQGTPCKPP